MNNNINLQKLESVYTVLFNLNETFYSQDPIEESVFDTFKELATTLESMGKYSSAVSPLLDRVQEFIGLQENSTLEKCKACFAEIIKEFNNLNDSVTKAGEESTETYYNDPEVMRKAYAAFDIAAKKQLSSLLTELSTEELAILEELAPKTLDTLLTSEVSIIFEKSRILYEECPIKNAKFLEFKQIYLDTLKFATHLDLGSKMYFYLDIYLNLRVGFFLCFPKANIISFVPDLDKLSKLISAAEAANKERIEKPSKTKERTFLDTLETLKSQIENMRKDNKEVRTLYLKIQECFNVPSETDFSLILSDMQKEMARLEEQNKLLKTYGITSANSVGKKAGDA